MKAIVTQGQQVDRPAPAGKPNTETGWQNIFAKGLVF
jgi:hypothetical protein